MAEKQKTKRGRWKAGETSARHHRAPTIGTGTAAHEGDRTARGVELPLPDRDMTAQGVAIVQAMAAGTLAQPR